MGIHRFVLHNSEIREASEASLRPGQLGLLSGWGVFSTLHIIDGVPFAWDRHWARMMRDVKLMHVDVPAASEEVRARLLALIEANQAFDSTLRIVIVRNGGGMWEGPPTGAPSDVLALTAGKNAWGTSVRLTYQPDARHSKSDFARAKILSWAQNLTWYERAHEAGFDECILLNELGQVTECTSANLFLVEGSRVWTAPLSAGCLPGVTREILLSEIHVPGIEIGERVITPADLATADEIFITSTTRDLLPVSEIPGRTLPLHRPVQQQLSAAFRKYVQGYVTAHRSSARDHAPAAPVAG